jgi:hypothetical protein
MSFIRKNKNLLFACFASLALILAHYVIFSEDYSGHAKKLEEQFQQKQVVFPYIFHQKKQILEE